MLYKYIDVQTTEALLTVYYYCFMQNNYSFQLAELENDLAIAMDISGSIRLENFRSQIAFVQQIVYGINMPDNRVSLITFGDEATTRWAL